MREDDKIIIKGMRFYGYHGVHPEEKKQGQWFELDIEIQGDFSKACLSDDLQDAINYSEVYRIIKKIVEGNSVNLLEKLAYQVIEAVLPLSPAKKVLVRIKKPGLLLGGPLSAASVEIVRSRDED